MDNFPQAERELEREMCEPLYIRIHGRCPVYLYDIVIDVRYDEQGWRG